MSEVRFYHLMSQRMEQALPALLSKAYGAGKRIIVKCENAAQVKQLNDHLWSYDAASFLPHGVEKDGHADFQPIYITEKDENPNGSDTLILVGGEASEMLKDFELCCEMFDGNDPAAVKEARARWKSYKEQEFGVTYWQQTQAGGWEQKA